MNRWRWLLLGLCWLGPILILAGLGAWWVWQHPWGLWFSWGILAVFILGYFLAWHWQRRYLLLPSPKPTELPGYWQTPDQQAWGVVQRCAQAVETTPLERLKSPQWFYDTALQLAQEIAGVYHPQSADPFGHLRIPEILTAVELAAHDLYQLVITYVPGSHLLMVQHLRQATQVVQWYRRLSTVYWAVSAALSPVQTAARYLTQRVGLAPLQEKLLGQLLGWFAQAFVYRLGWYLVELHSGRLQVGADQYRRALAQGRVPTPWSRELALDLADSASTDTRWQPDFALRVLVVGQAKSGKSSLVNALLGACPAPTHVVTPTSGFAEYRRQYTLAESPSPAGRQAAGNSEKTPHTFSLILVDSPGYPTEETSRDEAAAFWQQVRQAHVILLTFHARQAGRQADRRFLQELAEHTATAAPSGGTPPVLGVLTHVDLLPPVLQWQPPYDWHHPQRDKERHIAEAVAAIREQVPLQQVFPMCTAVGRVWGVEQVITALVSLLPQAQAQAVLTTLLAEPQKHKWSRLLKQVRSLLGQAWRIVRP
ncbi:GTPase Der [bacterium HR36]|nr:GTPase Der [bacterium HR36]